MLAIRLARVGAKKKPAYRIVVTEKSRARNSSSLEILGHYNPTKDPILLSLKRERIEYWVSKGAQPSKTVERLMRYVPPESATVGEEKPNSVREPASDSQVEAAGEQPQVDAPQESEPPAQSSAEDTREKENANSPDL